MTFPLAVRPIAVVAALAFGACAHPAPPQRPLPERRLAALDSASARRLCAEPDRVLAGRTACVLRNQAPPLRVF